MIAKFYIKFVFSFLLYSLFLTVAFADTADINKTQSSNAFIIPLELNGKMKGMPLINVKINGQILHLALDTGADSVFFALTPEALKKINVKISDAVKNNLDVNGKLYKSRTVEISSIEMEELLFNNIEVCEELRNTDDGSEGIVGNKIFDNFNVLIDYSQSRITLYPNINPPYDLDLDKWLKFPFKHEDIGIIIYGFSKKQKKNLRFCLDSGAVAVNEKGEAFNLLKSTSLINRKQIDKEKTYDDNIIINKKNIYPMNFYLLDFTKPDVDGFLGYAFLSKYKIFIDFKKEFIYIKD